MLPLVTLCETPQETKKSLPNTHPPIIKYLQTIKVAYDEEEDSDQYDEDEDELETTTPAVRSERPFNYVSNREEKQSLMFRNAQMVNSQ